MGVEIYPLCQTMECRMTIANDDLVWSITGLKTKDITSTTDTNLADAVVQTYWKVSYTDSDGNEAFFSGASPLDVDEMTDDEFVSLADLTEEVVIGWVKEVVEGGHLDHVKEQLQKQINEQVVNEPSLPWASEEE